MKYFFYVDDKRILVLCKNIILIVGCILMINLMNDENIFK